MAYMRNNQMGSDGGGSTYRGGAQGRAVPSQNTQYSGVAGRSMAIDPGQRQSVASDSLPLRDNQLSLPKAPGFSFGNAGWGNTVAPRPMYPRNEKALNMGGWSNFNKNFRPIQSGPVNPGKWGAMDAIQPIGPGAPQDTGVAPNWAASLTPEQRYNLGAQFDNNMMMGPSPGGWAPSTINNPPMYNSVGAGGGK